VSPTNARVLSATKREARNNGNPTHRSKKNNFVGVLNTEKTNETQSGDSKEEKRVHTGH
jgi:hypothetical protein